MRVEINRAVLAKVLKLTRFAEKASTMPVANCIRFEANPVGVQLAATDFTASIQGTIPAETSEAGETAIPARPLRDIVNAMDGETVVLHEERPGEVTIESGHSTFRLLTLDPSDFPAFVSPPNKLLPWSSEILRKLLSQVEYAISSDSTRPHIAGTRVEYGPDIFRLAATDGHRLSVAEVPLEDGLQGEFATTLPGAVLAEMRALTDVCGDAIQVSLNDGYLHVRGDLPEGKAAVQLALQVTEAQFPPYEKVIPESHTYAWEMDRADLLAALKRMSVMASDNIFGVTFRALGGTATFDIANSSTGSATEELSVDGVDVEEPVCVNIRYFIQALDPLEGNVVHLEFGNPLDPVVIRDEARRFVGVIMPMRV